MVDFCCGCGYPLSDRAHCPSCFQLGEDTARQEKGEPAPTCSLCGKEGLRQTRDREGGPLCQECWDETVVRPILQKKRAAYLALYEASLLEERVGKLRTNLDRRCQCGKLYHDSYSFAAHVCAGWNKGHRSPEIGLTETLDDYKERGGKIEKIVEKKKEGPKKIMMRRSSILRIKKRAS